MLYQLKIVAFFIHFMAEMICDVAKKHDLSSTSAIFKENGFKTCLNFYAMGGKYPQNSILKFFIRPYVKFITLQLKGNGQKL